MKTAIYINDGTAEIVLTPETPLEDQVVEAIRNMDCRAKIFTGGFYECQGGWIRQATMGATNSMIIRLDKPDRPSEDPCVGKGTRIA